MSEIDQMSQVYAVPGAPKGPYKGDGLKRLIQFLIQLCP